MSLRRDLIAMLRRKNPLPIRNDLACSFPTFHIQGRSQCAHALIQLISDDSYFRCNSQTTL